MKSAGLLIGGSSSVGKTTLARQLVGGNGLLVQTDECLPKEHPYDPIAGPETWSLDPLDVRDLLIRAAEAARPHLRAEAEKLSHKPLSWVMEGERVHPLLVDELRREGIAEGVFIVETSAAQLASTLMARTGIDLEMARRVSEVNRLYGLWLVEEAERLNLRCVGARPWETLRNRSMLQTGRQHFA